MMNTHNSIRGDIQRYYRGGKQMSIDITPEEKEFLRELFEEKQKHLIREINHTDTGDFRSMLREQVNLLEGLMRKVEEQ